MLPHKKRFVLAFVKPRLKAMSGTTIMIHRNSWNGLIKSAPLAGRTFKSHQAEAAAVKEESLLQKAFTN